jgi:hypothetical protein
MTCPISDALLSHPALSKNTSIKSIRLERHGKVSGEQRNQIEPTLREQAGGNAQ